MIVIKENGLALYFEVSENNHLHFYGITDGEFPAVDESLKAN